MAAPHQDVIVLFGDSLTSRQDVPWNLHHQLSEVYRRKLDVLNRGYGGYNTAWVREIFDEIFLKQSEVKAGFNPAVRLVTIWLGTNDSVLPGHDQHVPLDQFKQNMNFFLESLTSPSSSYATAHLPEALNIVLITPTIFNPLQWEVELAEKDKSRSLEDTRKYKDAVLEIGKEWKRKETEGEGGGRGWKIGTIDLWEAMTVANGGKEDGKEMEKLFNDGLHFTTEGYAVLWDKLSHLIKTEFKGRGLDWEDTNDLPFRVPDFVTIDFDRLKSIKEKMALPACRR